MSSKRRLRVKFVLPALTEASSPFWRPIKYSLFPPLGLATLAAYLAPDDDAVIVDEHVEPLRIDDAPDLDALVVAIAPSGESSSGVVLVAITSDPCQVRPLG